MTHAMLSLVAAIVLLVAGGCATEKWTQTLFAKREAEVDARFVEHGERIDRVEGRVSHLEVALTETREQVRDALTPPPTTPVRTSPPARPRPPRTASARTLVAIVHVPFGFDRADFDASAEAALTSIVKQLREHPTMTLDLEGMTDNIGTFDYNIRLSQRRVAAVTRWLSAHGVDGTRIVGAASRGPVPSGSAKDPTKRRVVVKLMTPGD
jgi:outer membrane protein OmpA-like peptidoglycan-associated protein